MSFPRCLSKYQFLAMLPAVPFFLLAGFMSAIYLHAKHKRVDLLSVVKFPESIMNGRMPESVFLLLMVIGLVIGGIVLFLLGIYLLRSRLFIRKEEDHTTEIIAILVLFVFTVFFFMLSGIQLERDNISEFGFDGLFAVASMFGFLVFLAEHCPRHNGNTDSNLEAD